MTRVKICGITRERDLETAVDAGADAVGIVSDVTVETPREVERSRARELLSQVPPFVTGVVVTMPADGTEAIDLVEAVEPDAVQIHGNLSLSELETVSAETDVTLLCAVDATEIETATAYDEIVDGFVVDSTDDAGGGGTGRTYDWEQAGEETLALESPVVLAGGLTPENVAEAVSVAEPFGVDVASGVEARGGIKDPNAVAAFVENATGVDRDVVRTEA